MRSRRLGYGRAASNIAMIERAGAPLAAMSSSASRSSIVSRRRITRASPSRDEHGRGPRDAVVVRAHRQRVGACRRDREQVAAARATGSETSSMRTSPDSQCIPATLTSSSGSSSARSALQRRVARVVELRTRVVRHPAVDGDPGPLLETLDRADAVERDAGAADEAAARLEPDRGLGQTPLAANAVACRRRGGGRELGGVGHLVVGVMPDSEAAAEVRDARLPAERRRGTLRRTRRGGGSSPPGR